MGFSLSLEGQADRDGFGVGCKRACVAGACAGIGRRSEISASGISPLAAKREAQSAAVPETTFGDVADAYIEAMSPQWRNAKHKAQWTMTLSHYASPLRSMDVSSIATDDVVEALKPLWTRTPETAERLRGRIEAVLDSAKAKGLRSGENPARWRGHLALILPKRQRLTRGHHAALPYRKIPAFMEQLRQHDSVGAVALEFCILTAARSGEVLGARWDEVSPKEKIWTIPAERMKGAREHRIPLSQRSMGILRNLHAAKAGPFIFNGQKQDRPLSSMALAMQLRRLGRMDITVHGFRSSFRDWVWEETDFPRELAEQALAHTLQNKAEAAYRRGDAIEKRRAMMDTWADFCESGVT